MKKRVHMKKIFNISLIVANVLFAVLAVWASIYGVINHIVWMQNFATISLIALGVINVAYGFVFKTPNKWFGILVLLQFAVILVVKNNLISNYILGITMLISAQVVLIGALVFNGKLAVSDLFYGVALALPVILTLILAPAFAFEKAGWRALSMVVMACSSLAVAKSVANVIKKQSLSNILTTLGTVLNFVFCLLIVVVKYFNVSFIIDFVIIIGLFVTQAVLILSTAFEQKDTLIKNNITSKRQVNVASHIKFASSLFMAVIVVCYALVLTASNEVFFTPKISKQGFYNAVGNDLNIPVVEISTEDNANPVNKKDYINCAFSITNCEDADQNFSVEMKVDYGDEDSVGIRLRGNSTRKGAKRPYRIKFDKKKSLFGLKKNKNWVLLADYYDQSYIRNYTAFTLADSLDNLDFSPTGHHVALIINNEFKGLYLLCEQMDEKEGRINVEEDFDITVDTEFPFLVEVDYFAYKEGVTGVDNFEIKSISNHAEIKYPEGDERFATVESDVVYDYIYEYINAVFTSLKTNQKVDVSFISEPVGFTDLVDVNSAVDFYLANEIMLNFDSVAKSIYLHKTKTGKLEFGPIWDFDLSMTTQYDTPFQESFIEETNNLYIANKSEIFSELFRNESFYNLVSTRYNSIKQSIVDVSNSLKDYKAKIDNVAHLDLKLWRGDKGLFEYDMQYDYVRLFLLDRYEFLNAVFNCDYETFMLTYLR